MLIARGWPTGDLAGQDVVRRILNLHLGRWIKLRLDMVTESTS
jgi:hypothetical protein